MTNDGTTLGPIYQHFESRWPGQTLEYAYRDSNDRQLITVCEDPLLQTGMSVRVFHDETLKQTLFVSTGVGNLFLLAQQASGATERSERQLVNEMVIRVTTSGDVGCQQQQRWPANRMLQYMAAFLDGQSPLYPFTVSPCDEPVDVTDASCLHETFLLVPTAEERDFPSCIDDTNGPVGFVTLVTITEEERTYAREVGVDTLWEALQAELGPTNSYVSNVSRPSISVVRDWWNTRSGSD